MTENYLTESDARFMEEILESLNAYYRLNVTLEFSDRRKRGRVTYTTRAGVVLHGTIKVGSNGPQSGTHHKDRSEYKSVAWVWSDCGYHVYIDQYGNHRLAGVTGRKHLWSFMLHEYAHILAPHQNHNHVYQEKLRTVIRLFPYVMFEQQQATVSADEAYFASLIA